MPASVYSVRFLEGALFSGDVSATVPTGKVWIVRDLDAFDINAASGDSLFLIGSLGQGLYRALKTDTNTQSFQWRGRQVFTAGETVTVETSAGLWGFALCGYSLTAP